MTQNEQRRIWTEMLDADTRSLYFADLVRYYHGIEHYVTIGIVVLSSGGVWTALAAAPAWLRVGVSILTGVCSTVLLVQKFSRKAELCADLPGQLSRLVAKYEDLWDNLDRYPDARERWKDLQESSNSLSKTATAFPNKVRRLRRWKGHVLKRRGLK